MKLKGTCRNTALKAFRLTHIFHEMAGFVFTFKLENQERQLTTFSFYYNYTISLPTTLLNSKQLKSVTLESNLFRSNELLRFTEQEEILACILSRRIHYETGLRSGRT